MPVEVPSTEDFDELGKKVDDIAKSVATLKKEVIELQEHHKPLLLQVQPLSAHEVYKSYGVCTHPTFTTSIYASSNAWTTKLKEMNAYSFRGLYSTKNSGSIKTIAEARRTGRKWLAPILPENWSVTGAEVQAIVNHIAANAADVVIAVEGVNEPNHERDGSTPPADWAKRAFDLQKILYEAIKGNPALSHVEVIGPSLHMSVATAEEDYKKLAALGVRQYMDYCGLHRYQNAQTQDHKLDQSLSWIKNSYGNVPVWITESGYHNAINTTDSHKPVPESVSAIYGPRLLFKFASLGIKQMRYELLDDVDSGKANVESNFGLYRVGSQNVATWTAKAEVAAMSEILNDLIDVDYQPAPVGLEVAAPADVNWLTTGKSDGTVTLWAYRNQSVWDSKAKVPILVPAVEVEYLDAAGAHTLSVGAKVVSAPVQR